MIREKWLGEKLRVHYLAVQSAVDVETGTTDFDVGLACLNKLPTLVE